MGFGESDNLPCPRCGFAIPINDILNPPPRPPRSLPDRILEGGLKTVGCLVMIAVAIFALFELGQCSGS